MGESLCASSAAAIPPTFLCVCMRDKGQGGAAVVTRSAARKSGRGDVVRDLEEEATRGGRVDSFCVSGRPGGLREGVLFGVLFVRKRPLFFLIRERAGVSRQLAPVIEMRCSSEEEAGGRGRGEGGKRPSHSCATAFEATERQMCTLSDQPRDSTRNSWFRVRKLESRLEWGGGLYARSHLARTPVDVWPGRVTVRVLCYSRHTPRTQRPPVPNSLSTARSEFAPAAATPAPAPAATRLIGRGGSNHRPEHGGRARLAVRALARPSTEEAANDIDDDRQEQQLLSGVSVGVVRLDRNGARLADCAVTSCSAGGFSNNSRGRVVVGAVPTREVAPVRTRRSLAPRPYPHPEGRYRRDRPRLGTDPNRTGRDGDWDGVGGGGGDAE